jgi:tetratricopeptide (TPR) repeat protein
MKAEEDASSSDSGAARRRLLAGMALVFLLALGLRLGHLYGLKASFEGTELFSITRVDAAHHWREAELILEGDERIAERVPWKGPGYSWFLAGLAALLGRDPGTLRWPLAVLGSLNCVLLVLLARRLLPLRWSLVAGALAAVNGLLIVYDSELYFPTLLIALNLPVFLLLGRKRAGIPAAGGAGVLLGLSVLVHPAYLVPATLLAIWIFRESLRKGAAFAVALALVLTPLALTNAFVRGEPVLVSWNGGINVYAANHPSFDQRAGNHTMAWSRILNTSLDAGYEGEAERDRLYYRLAARQALAHPVATARGLLLKAWLFFTPVEIASNFRIYELREHSPLLRPLLGRWGPLWVPFGLLGPAALVGLALLLGRREPLAPPLALWSAGIALTCVLFFNTARYRAPVALLGCLFAAAALAALWKVWRERDRWRLALGLGSFAALFALLAATAVPQRSLPPPLEWYQAAAMGPGESYEEVAGWAERALEHDPDSPALLRLVSQLHARWGRPDRQREILDRLLALPDPEPDVLDGAHEQKAQSYLAEGRLELARDELLAALAVRVDDAQWRGHSHYAMGLAPTRSCWLRLSLAQAEIALGWPGRARSLIEAVRADCPEGKRYREAIHSIGPAAGAGS